MSNYNHDIPSFVRVSITNNHPIALVSIFFFALVWQGAIIKVWYWKMCFTRWVNVFFFHLSWKSLKFCKIPPCHLTFPNFLSLSFGHMEATYPSTSNRRINFPWLLLWSWVGWEQSVSPKEKFRRRSYLKVFSSLKQIDYIHSLLSEFVEGITAIDGTFVVFFFLTPWMWVFLT